MRAFFDSEADARLFATRCVLLKSIYELWAFGAVTSHTAKSLLSRADLSYTTAELPQAKHMRTSTA